MTTPAPADGAATSRAATARREEFDVCVIGAGAAGLVLTEILSRQQSVRVCLVEAGPDHFRDRKEPFQVRSVLKEHTGVNEGRVTAFGGATNTWGGGLIRSSPADFQPLDGRADTAWPIPYDSLLPHYDAVESMFGFRAPADTVFLDRPDAVVRQRTISILPFRNKNFAKRFGPTVRSRPNVTVLCNATIVALEPDADGGLAHLDVRSGDASPMRIAARRYVISAGVVNTNLLAERVFEACGLRQSVEDQGRYFHDHVSFPVAILHPKSRGKFSRQYAYRFEGKLMRSDHFDIETKGARQPGAFLHMSPDMSTSSVLRPVRDILNAIQRRTLTLSAPLSLRDIAELFIGLPRLGFYRYFHRRLYLDRGTTIVVRLDLEQVPLRDWKLEREDDGKGCAVTWDLAAGDTALVARYLPVCMDILQKLRAAAEFDIEEVVPDPKANPTGFVEFLRRTCLDTLHSAGGLRMGSAPTSLVDSQLRLRGVRNVHALSAAVFPRVGTSNPTLTILALGHRLAQSILAGQ